MPSTAQLWKARADAFEAALRTTKDAASKALVDTRREKAQDQMTMLRDALQKMIEEIAKVGI